MQIFSTQNKRFLAKTVLFVRIFMMVIMISTTLFGSLTVYAQDVAAQEPARPPIAHVVDWTKGAFLNVKHWIQEQGSKVARALTGDQQTEPESPAVLGDSVAPEEDIIEEPLQTEIPLSQFDASQYGVQKLRQSASYVLAAPGVLQTLSVAYKNSGALAWPVQGVSLNTVWTEASHPLYHDSWKTARRPAIVEASVTPNNTYEFSFIADIPEEPGTYHLSVRPVIYNGSGFQWLGGVGVAAEWEIVVPEPESEEPIEVPVPPAAETKDSEDDDVTDAEEDVTTEGEIEAPATDNGTPSEPSPATGSEEVEVTEPAEPEAQPAPSSSAPGEKSAPDNANQLIGWSTAPVLAPDNVAPETSVSSLNSVTTDNAFTVSWTGTDNTRDGVASFDVQYQVDSGDWTDWLAETVLMSSVFTAPTDGAYGFRSRGRDYEGNTEEYPNSADASTTVDTTPDYSVVINEIAWAGTAANSAHQWMELYNTTSSSVNLTDWKLANSDGSFSITLAGSIPAKGYFLLESDASAATTTHDQLFSGSLSIGGEYLTLRKADTSFADKTGSSTVAWFAGSSAGNKPSMERKDPTSDGTVASNWASNDGVFIIGEDSTGTDDLSATPKSLNSVNTTIPRAVTNLQHQYVYTTTSSARLYWSTPKTADSSATTTTPTFTAYYEPSSGNCPITESNLSSVSSITGNLPATTEGAVATTTVSSLSTNTSYCVAIKVNNGAEDSALSNVYTFSTESGTLTNLGFPGNAVTSDKTVSVADSPYQLFDSFSINAGFTLTIEPGVVIKVIQGSGDNITVNGTLKLGSASDAVNATVITSTTDDTYNGDTNGDGSSTSPAAGDWGKITIGVGTGSLDFDHAIILYGGVSTPMVSMTAGSANISNSILAFSNNNVIALANDSTSLVLNGSTIRGGAQLQTAAGLDGIGVSTLADITVTNTTFTGNRRGIAVDGNADEVNISITNNNFYANNRASTPNGGVQISDTDGTPVALSGNWWGDSAGPTLDVHSTTDSRDGVLDDTPDGSLDLTVVTTSHSSTQITVSPSGL